MILDAAYGKYPSPRFTIDRSLTGTDFKNFLFSTEVRAIRAVVKEFVKDFEQQIKL
jgi:hypothetical protein